MSRPYDRLGPQGSGQHSEERNPFDDPVYPYNHPQRPSPAPSPYQDSLYRPPMSPMQHPHDPYDTRDPSPAPYGPESYPLNSRPYADQQQLQIPMGPGPGPGTPSDRLAMQPSYSVEHVDNPYHTPYGQPSPYGQAPPPGGYAIDPGAHHDAYYTEPYQPTPGEDLGSYPGGQGDYFREEDTQPILDPHGPYGPDPGQGPPMEEEEDHYMNGGGGYMDADGRPAPAPKPAPVKRWKTVKEVQLFQGNLVLDCPVPPRLLNQMDRPSADRDEYSHMRYSAATCDPSEFYQERFTLRQRLFAKPRHTELFIVITMYNEEDELFARTMIGIIKNIEHMNSRTNSKTWGKDAWKKIVVCIVSDGRAKINPRTRAVLAGLGVYQDGIAKQQVNGKDVTAHVYEYTTQMTLDIKNHVVQVKRGTTPIQLLFCLKEKNQKKINSHRWFFQAFGSVLDPSICVLLDAGTKPGNHSIYHLWKCFERLPNCAGACGEIKAMLNHGRSLLNPLVAAQNFEYKISNILDKPLESVFGFISVLPGAFSAYRYIALQNDKRGQGPLEKYFKGETMHGANAGIFSANMYLAEYRILCFELVAKRDCHWVLQYVKGATGETDVPTEVPDFISQRRRWLNGSFFAAIYALVHFYQIFSSGHSFLRKLMFLVEFFYQTFNMLFAWFAIGNFFLVFRILTYSLAQPSLLGTAGTVLAVIFEWLYLITLVACFVLSLGNTPKGSRKFYLTMVYFWVFIMIYLMFAAVFITVRAIQTELAGKPFSVDLLFKNTLFVTLIVSLGATYVLYLVMSILFLDPWHMFTSFIQYLLLTPTYVNILNVYAFCNTHDVTWGTKGQTTPDKLQSVNVKPGGGVDVSIPDNEHDLNSQYEAELRLFAVKEKKEKEIESPEDKHKNYYQMVRSAVVLVWMFSNLALTAVVLNTGGFDQVRVGEDEDEVATQNSTIYMSVVLYSVAALSAFRWVGGAWFLILRLLRGI